MHTLAYAYAHTHTYIYNMYIIYMYSTCDVSHSCHVATYILNRQVPIAGCTTRLAPVRHGRFHSSTLEVPELNLGILREKMWEMMG